ncbi:MAG: substrate-binding domain-containing protein [Melioribacteraceae bacterium]|nr:substrate-binding domain-containing protein [Melioribacteraceae bacterium]
MNLIKSVLFVLITLSIYGCQDVANELAGKKPDDARTIKISMIAKSNSNIVFLSAKEGAESAALNLSDKYSMIDVDVDWNTPDVDDPAVQVEYIRDAVKHKYDAVLVSCSDKDSLTSAINQAVDQGLLVMTFDSDAPESKRFAFYGPDDVEMGKTLMNELAVLLEDKGKIAVLGGSKEAPNLQNRVKGVKEALSQYPGIELAGEYYHAENEDSAISKMTEVIELHPDLNGWAMVGGWPMFGEKLLTVIEPGKYKIVAVDALPEQLIYIEKGIVQVLLAQPTFKWGEIGVETIINKIHLKKDIKGIIPLNPLKISIENLGGWSRQLRAWGYKGIPEKYLIM